MYWLKSPIIFLVILASLDLFLLRCSGQHVGDYNRIFNYYTIAILASILRKFTACVAIEKLFTAFDQTVAGVNSTSYIKEASQRMEFLDPLVSWFLIFICGFVESSTAGLTVTCAAAFGLL